VGEAPGLDKRSLNKSELCGSSGEQKTESLFFLNKFMSRRCCRIISTEELHFQAFVDQFQPKTGVRGYIFLTNSGLFLPFFLR